MQGLPFFQDLPATLFPVADPPCKFTFRLITKITPVLSKISKKIFENLDNLSLSGLLFLQERNARFGSILTSDRKLLESRLEYTRKVSFSSRHNYVRLPTLKQSQLSTCHRNRTERLCIEMCKDSSLVSHTFSILFSFSQKLVSLQNSNRVECREIHWMMH